MSISRRIETNSVDELEELAKKIKKPAKEENMIVFLDFPEELTDAGIYNN